MKKVSIIIPLYKSENYICKLLESVIKQTYANLEIILVDDGSPDDSGRIADDYSLLDSRIMVIHKLNGGTCEARNVGLQRVTGDYLMFVDGDDWLELDCVQYLVTLLEDNNAEMALTDSIFTTRDRVQNIEDNVRVWTNKEAVANIVNTFYIPVGPWNKLYSMKVIHDNDISFSVAWFGEGLFFSVMAAQYSKKVVVGHRKIYNYRLNNPNSGCTKREVINAINSLNNILYIKEKLIVSDEKIQQALNWHIWTNNFNLISYVIGASKEAEYKDNYINAKRELKQLLPDVLKHDMLTLRNKLRIYLSSYFPRIMAQYYLKRAEKEFEKDKIS